MINKFTNIKIPKYKLDYSIEKNKNIVQGSLTKNIKLPFSCRSGVCGTCKAKIIQGNVHANNKINHVLTESDVNNNIILMCQAEPVSDLLELEIISPMPRQIQSGKPREIISEILSVKQITPEVIDISISVSKRFYFNLNQLSYMEILIPGLEIKEKYYISNFDKKNNQSNDGVINILVIKSKNLDVNEYLNKNLIAGEVITLKGPYADNNFPNFLTKPTLLLTNHTNIIKTLIIVNQLLSSGCNFPIMLISYFNDKKNIFLMEEMHKLQFLYKNFSYKITLRNQDRSNTNRFLLGSISKVINKIFPDLSSHYIYINGDESFLIKIRKKIIELEAKEENIYTDLYN